MPACHAGGHEFESRTHRFLIVKKVNVVAFTFFIFHQEPPGEIYSMSNFAQWPLHENYSLTEQN